MNYKPTVFLTIATIKMWFRDRSAMFWNFVIPVIIMSIFGVLNFGSFNTVDLGIVDMAENDNSTKLVQELLSIGALNITVTTSLSDERQALIDGEREMILVIPTRFMENNPPSEVNILYNSGRPQEVQIGSAIINEALHTLTLTGTDRLFEVSLEPITDKDFSYIDFLLPGIIAMSIMQMGMFSVAFSFIQLKRLGILRRLFATPISPSSLLCAQVITRLLVSIVQTILLISIAILFFNAEVIGNVLGILLIAVIGGAVFLSMGFGVAGWAKNENVAAPLANVIALPMMFLSGIFFGRDFLPDILYKITNYLPLTYLVNGLRNISSEGESIFSQGENLIGLLVWLIISFILATRLFRWE